MEEKVILVDEADQTIGEAEKIRAHQQALLHRAFSVFVFRKQEGLWELLVHQRHLGKYHCGGFWTNTCCGHPRPQEEITQAAARRLREEMGIEVPLHEVDHFHYRATFDNGLTEDEIDHVFIGIDQGDSFEVNAEEVEAFRWIMLQQLDQELKQQEKLVYTPWFQPALDIALKGLKRYINDE